ncbi:unnamed protein product [Pleuronectes platessa]|uniref:Uncharacterized protein n=1 Tax=Pleuronectes platessa TaxID=8262 RepID=A0A9N7UGN0_PLEPL|nr:unnamed protein product [Pleuronectes platessa]
MAGTWAIKARAQSNQLCAIPPMAPVVPGMCSTQVAGVQRPRPNPQSGESRPHMYQDVYLTLSIPPPSFTFFPSPATSSARRSSPATPSRLSRASPLSSLQLNPYHRRCLPPRSRCKVIDAKLGL